MSISPGDRLGLYEVISPLGAGGMGEVCRARDAKLGRDVATNVLGKRVVACGPEEGRAVRCDIQGVAGGKPRPVALLSVSPFTSSDDGKSCAYACRRMSSHLFLVEGAR